MKVTCSWPTTPLYQAYHDYEWGRPIHDDQHQFEHLCLESLQCGLSWLTILNKRDIIRQCFDYFDVDAVAKYTETDIERIMSTEGMLKSRKKIEAIINNAQAFQRIQDEFTKAIQREGCLLKMNCLRALAKTLRNEGSNL